jgi:hypothetical protein
MEKKMNKTCLFIVLLLFIVFIEGHAEEEGVIIKYDSLLSLTASSNYNFMVFQPSSANDFFHTNRPWDIGIKLGIWKFSIGFSYSFPSKFKESQAFEITLDNVTSDRHYSYGYFKYYRGFNNGGNNYIDLRLISAGLSYEFLFNRNHSLAAAYTLDRKQTVSNGSFIAGFGVFFNSIKFASAPNQNEFYFGPNAGYSYTFVINDFYVNLLATVGAGGVLNKGEFSLGLQALPKIAIGYHTEKWSANINSTLSYLMIKPGAALQHSVITGNIGAAFIYRFISRNK